MNLSGWFDFCIRIWYICIASWSCATRRVYFMSVMWCLSSKHPHCQQLLQQQDGDDNDGKLADESRSSRRTGLLARAGQQPASYLLSVCNHLSPPLSGNAIQVASTPVYVRWLCLAAAASTSATSIVGLMTARHKNKQHVNNNPECRVGQKSNKGVFNYHVVRTNTISTLS